MCVNYAATSLLVAQFVNGTVYIYISLISSNCDNILYADTLI